MNEPWTDEQNDWLKRHWGKLGREECARRLHKSGCAVYKHAKRIGLPPLSNHSRRKLIPVVPWEKTKGGKAELEAQNILEQWGFFIVEKGTVHSPFDYRASLGNQVFAIEVRTHWHLGGDWKIPRLEPYGIPAFLVKDSSGWQLFVRLYRRV